MVMITIPIPNHIILIFAENDINSEEIIEKMTALQFLG